MKKTKISIIVTSLILLVATMFTMTSCTLGKKTSTDDESEKLVETTALSTQFVNTANIKLMAASEPMMAASTGVITQKITATVYPENASNKQVDWSIAWGNTSNTANVSDFVSVTPDSDGSTSATVTCKQAFTGTIVITATTRQNGYKADCIVTFVGVPANIEVSTSLTPGLNGYHLAVGNTYTFGTELSNPFGTVGDGYKDLKVTVGGVGTIKVASKEVYVSSGNTKWYDEGAKNLDINSIAGRFIEASVATDGTVTVKIIKSIESYYGSMERIDSGRTQYYQDCFRDYVTDCYFTITVTSPLSGVSTTFNVVIDPNAVTGVDVNNPEMFF